MLRIAAIFAAIVWVSAPVSAADITGRMAFWDADTLRVGTTKVRLFGVDAPEQDQTCQRANGKDWACGKWATRRAKTQFDGRKARCDFIELDRYGRSVARCFSGGQDIAEILTQQGVTQAFTRYSLDYVSAEKLAVVARLGIWAGSFTEPATFRAQNRAPAQVAPTSCKIKGNISKGGHIYHVPGQKYYTKTRISGTKGERWFCSEADARAAGWRKARN